MTNDEGMTKPETASNSAFPHSAFRIPHSRRLTPTNSQGRGQKPEDRERRMKLIRLFVCAIAGAALMARGQDAAQSTVDLHAKGNQENPSAATPAISPALPELSQLDEIFKQTSLGKTADEYRMRVEWRKLQNQVANDRSVVAAKKAAASARTDLEKRKRLGDYYKI